MVWFYCDDCGDTIKKAKVMSHFHSCSASSFTCIDCSRVFHRGTVSAHTQCVTEHEKYAQGATKPGGYAASGFFKEGGAGVDPGSTAGAGATPEATLAGQEFLAQYAPWRCSICSVTCTSQATLAGHAQGAKHRRRARAALAARNPAGAPEEGDAPGTAAHAAPEPAQQAETGVHAKRKCAAGDGGVAADAPPSKKVKKDMANAMHGCETDPTDATLEHVKWKKLAARALQACGGQATLKALRAAVLQAASLPSTVDAGKAGKALVARVRSSSKFVVDGKMIRLKNHV